MPRLADSTTTKISSKKDSRKIISSRINCGRSAQLDMLRCTAPRSSAHIEILFQLEIGEKWSTSIRLLLLIVLEYVRRQVLYIKQILCSCGIQRTRERETEDWKSETQIWSGLKENNDYLGATITENWSIHIERSCYQIL